MDLADDEIEEELVYIKFDSLFDKELFNPSVNFKLIGLDEDEPIVQLGAQVFTGKWETAAGTCTFFEEDPDYKSDDPIFNPPSKTNVKYATSTRKVLRMHRTVLKKKTDEVTDSHPSKEVAEATDSSEIKEKDIEEFHEIGDSSEADQDLSFEDIEKLALDQTEVNPVILDEILGK